MRARPPEPQRRPELTRLLHFIEPVSFTKATKPCKSPQVNIHGRDDRCQLNKQREIMALDRQGTQQHRPEYACGNSIWHASEYTVRKYGVNSVSSSPWNNTYKDD